MAHVDIFLLLIAAFFSLYGIFSCILSGTGLKLLGGDKKAEELFTPAWELANILAVVGLGLLALAFGDSLRPIGQALSSALAVGLAFLVMRAGLSIIITYRGGVKANIWLMRLYVLAAFGVPLSLSAAAAYLLTARQFWQTTFGWTLVVGMGVGAAATGLMIADRYLYRRVRSVTELVYLAWLVVLGSLLPSVVQHGNYLLSKAPFAILALFSFIGLCLVLAKYTFGFKDMWLYGVFLSFMAPILLIWANRPYLVSGNRTLAEAYANPAHWSAYIIAGGLTLLLVAPLTLYIKRKTT